MLRSCRVASLSSAEHGSGGGLQREELQPTCWFPSAAHLISTGHLLLVHFLLQLLEEIRHLNLLVVPQPVALHGHRHRRNLNMQN